MYFLDITGKPPLMKKAVNTGKNVSFIPGNTYMPTFSWWQ